ncbi:prepilin-type N-terminal cleavage/methylation domain-containing protein [Puniceicoccaceae bacterium]|jgi:hypothetical protein|nr:prepilin-type N-terminal cleavage/methylation domain-containing protein [Puniceicoccaceae bacterium]
MITTSTNTKRLPYQAFTLVELMFSMTILMIALGSITGTFMVFAKSSASLGEYVDMSSESRKALELFSRDVRAADGIAVIGATSLNGVVYTDQGLNLTFPDYYGNRSVTYSYDSTSGILRRIENYEGTQSESNLLTGMQQFKIQLFQAPGDDFESISGPVASVNEWAKSLQLDAELIRTVVTLDNTDYIISARFMMRNMK